MKQAKYITNYFTPLVQSITQGSGANALNFAYTYDSRGNITSETRNGKTTTYEYDALGQLTRVNDPNDPTAYNEGGLSNNGTTWIYAYDRGGNILSKAAYELTTGAVGTDVRTWLYEYNDANWKDKLTKFEGSTISYDAIGNPLSDGIWSYVWQAGRQLKSMSKTEGNDTIMMEFTYNHAGLRTKKVKKVNGVVKETTEYILNGKNVVELIHTNHDASEINKLHFYYDAQGRVALVDFNGTMYSYAHNLQGDIIGILDSSGNLVVEYKYDAWGKPVSVTGNLITTLGQLNPFRFRSYMWDGETNLYYLRSRYYSYASNRFLNSDSIIDKKLDFLVANLFIYCCNEPIFHVDSDGMKTIAIFYDSRPNTTGHKRGGFGIQANYYKEIYDDCHYTVYMCGYKDMSDNQEGFITKWNSLPDEVDRVIIIGHGAPGSFDAIGTRLMKNESGSDIYSISELKDIHIKEKLFIYTCNSGTPAPGGGESMAELLSLKTRAPITVALYYAKTYWLFETQLSAEYDSERRRRDKISELAPLLITISCP